MPLSRHAHDWEELAGLDPLWAIASSPDKRFGGWEREEFFATGERVVAATLARIAELQHEVTPGTALDFGCGVGRMTRALAARFEHVVGVDIAPTMIDRGRELNADVDNIEFLVNHGDDLSDLGDRLFDLVFTRIVLQHQPSRAAARRYVEEFIRVLEPGGVIVLQIPIDIPLRYRLLITRRAYVILRALRIPARVLYERLHLHPIRMLFVPRSEVEDWVRRAGGRILAVDASASPQGVVSGTFYAAGPAEPVQ
jgi:SAM-dependent methyltransferase